MRRAHSDCGSMPPVRSSGKIEPRGSLIRNAHLQRAHVYRYGCGLNQPDFGRHSITKLWRASRSEKAPRKLRTLGICNTAARPSGPDSRSRCGFKRGIEDGRTSMRSPYVTRNAPCPLLLVLIARNRKARTAPVLSHEGCAAPGKPRSREKCRDQWRKFVSPGRGATSWRRASCGEGWPCNAK